MTQTWARIAASVVLAASLAGCGRYGPPDPIPPEPPEASEDEEERR
jgi:predicted small lipoprotein YifL